MSLIIAIWEHLLPPGPNYLMKIYGRVSRFAMRDWNHWTVLFAVPPVQNFNDFIEIRL